MKRYLVAVDGSDPSRKAAQAAVELAEKTGAEVTLAFCVVPVMTSPDVMWVATAEIDQAQERAGMQILAETKASFSKSKTKIVTVLLRGHAAETIADVAKEQGFDLLVVGSRGHGAVKRLMLGSVATRLLHICEKPMLIVR